MRVQDWLILRDDQWDQMSAHVIGDEGMYSSLVSDNRMFAEAVLWIG